MASNGAVPDAPKAGRNVRHPASARSARGVGVGTFLMGKELERVMGVEPTYSAWKAAALPLSYTRVALFYRQAGAGMQAPEHGAMQIA